MINLDYLIEFLNTPLAEVPLPIFSSVVEITPNNLLQFFSTILAFTMIVLTIQKKGYAWILNIIKKLLGFIVYIAEGLYAKIALDTILIIKSLYGLFKWGYKSPKKNAKEDITILTKSEFFNFLSLAIAGWIIFGIILSFLYEAYPWLKGRRPFIDSFHCAFNIINYYLLANKKRECWLFSFAGHVAYAYLFITGQKGFAFKYVGYLILSVRGYYKWDKAYKKSIGKTS